MFQRQRTWCVFSICTALFLTLTTYTSIAEASPAFQNGSVIQRIHNYEITRALLVDNEFHQQLGGKIQLSSSEDIANERIMAAKLIEYEEGLAHPSQFKPTQHFFKVYEQIAQTKLFKLLKTMPKGGLLHAHDTALGSTDILIDLSYRQHLWICVTANEHEYKLLRFSLEKPNITEICDWNLLKQLRDDQGANEIDQKLREHLTLYPHQQFADSNDAWETFHGIFGFVDGLLTFEPVWGDYHYNALEELYEDGIQYLELRSTLPTLYNLNGDNFTTADSLRILYEMEEKFRRQHSDFIGVKLIYTPTRNHNENALVANLNKAIQLKNNFPDYLAGFDLVSPHEELRHPLKDFSHNFIAVENELDYYFHAGETNWYGTTTDENLLDAVLLGSKRIGHGFALPKHPEVLRYLKLKNIAVEVCPISNQVLQHLNDFRNHPAAYLFAHGYPVVIASDDPSFWKSSPLTHDLYIAFLGIASKSANLGMLKQLAINSLEYSALNETRKQKAIDMWNQKWKAWIEQVALAVISV